MVDPVLFVFVSYFLSVLYRWLVQFCLYLCLTSCPFCTDGWSSFVCICVLLLVRSVQMVDPVLFVFVSYFLSVLYRWLIQFCLYLCLTSCPFCTDGWSSFVCICVLLLVRSVQMVDPVLFVFVSYFLSVLYRWLIQFCLYLCLTSCPFCTDGWSSFVCICVLLLVRSVQMVDPVLFVFVSYFLSVLYRWLIQFCLYLCLTSCPFCTDGWSSFVCICVLLLVRSVQMVGPVLFVFVSYFLSVLYRWLVQFCLYLCLTSCPFCTDG